MFGTKPEYVVANYSDQWFGKPLVTKGKVYKVVKYRLLTCGDERVTIIADDNLPFTESIAVDRFHRVVQNIYRVKYE